MSKRNFWPLVVSVVLLGTIALFGSHLLNVPPTSAVAAEVLPQETAPAALPRTITVVGYGSVSAVPDVATIMLGVEVRAPTVEDAMDEAGDRMTEIMTALEGLDIPKKDITTSNYTINYEQPPSYEKPPLSEQAGEETEEPQGVYRVSNMVTVKLHNLDKVGELIDAAVSAGANSLWGVNFSLENTDKVEADARAAAMTDARARAEELAKLAGVQVGDVLQISEVIGSSYYPTPALVKGVAAQVEMAGGAGPISPGELDFSQQIQVTFELK